MCQRWKERGLSLNIDRNLEALEKRDANLAMFVPTNRHECYRKHYGRLVWDLLNLQ
jgi:hypothetical protein